jgi:hypothetical protein
MGPLDPGDARQAQFLLRLPPLQRRDGTLPSIAFAMLALLRRAVSRNVT